MKILVPIDGSGYSLRAVEYAAKMADGMEGATVDIMYVIVYEANFMDSALVMEELGEKAAAEALDDAEKEFAKHTSLKPNKITKTGSSAANAVITVVDKEKYDQIIMGSKGKSNLERFLVGSVSNKIVHHAPCTVTLVR